jgi:biopolymer transport protein ExbB/TolQ
LLWNIIGKAGGFQYPIFGILVVGLFLILMKVYELYRDRRASEALKSAPIGEMGTDDLATLVSEQQQSMLAELQATLLNVYQTTRDAGTLHEEIANFIQFQRERFDTFKRRVDFLADTAGAVGLLGTVWGMFTLFYGGNISDKQAILGGMGVALISTLLGLVVSITLNLISTEVYSFFDSRIDQIEEEGDQLRFRLMELSTSGDGAPTEAGASAAVSDGVAGASTDGASRGASATSANSGGAGTPAVASATASGEATSTAEAQAKPEPAQLEVAGLPAAEPVDSHLSDIQLRVVATDGTPVPDVPVRARVNGNSGTLNGGTSEVTLRTDDDGQVTFAWHLPEEAGDCVAEVELPEVEGVDVSRTLSVRARPAAPSHYKKSGNNQGAQGGNELSNPLAVALFDEYKNPVPGHPVRFRVVSGDGTFGDGRQKKKVKTGEEGRADVSFAVGEDPGLNAVEASVGDETVEFQAMTLGQ